MFNHTETHDLLISLIGNAPYGILTTDLDGYVSIVNQQFLKNFDLADNLNEVLETSVLGYLSSIPNLKKLVKECLENENAPFDLLAVACNGKYLNIRGRSFLRGIILTTEDVTAAKEMESFQAMIDGQEAERKRLASEIHDGVGAMLSTLTMSLESMRPQIKKEVPDLLKKHEQSMKLAKSINRDLRSISHALMPSTLVDFGLAQAIKMLCDTINSSSTIKTSFYHKGLEKRLPRNVELSLYRIAQEIVNNAIKYSKAKNLTIQLIRYPKSILLMTEDDGVGFDKAAVEKDKKKGIGLRNIKIRTKSIGGSFNIDAQSGRGVSTTIDVPLN